MRMIIFLVMVFLISVELTPSNATKIPHKYDSGILSGFSNNQVTIESGTYTLRSDVKIVLIVKESNGARYERKGSLSDVTIGKRVYLKTVGRTVSEILIER